MPANLRNPHVITHLLDTNIVSYLASGQPADQADLLIAAQALAGGLILITHDRAFSRIKQLKIEDWTRERD
jgi:predicted nucleic acid-binding protein